MNSNKSSFGLSSSPHSSDGGVDSPDTKGTVFSPDQARLFKTPGMNGANDGPPSFSLEPAHYQLPSFLKSPDLAEPTALKRGLGLSLLQDFSKDPFVTATVKKMNGCGQNEQKLSPTASSFTPLTGSSPWSTGFGQFCPSSSKSASSCIDFLNTTTVSDNAPTDASLKQYLKSVAVMPSHLHSVDRTPSKPEVGSGSPGSPTERIGLGEDNAIARAIAIQGVDSSISVKLLKEYFNVHLFPSLRGPVLVDLNSTGIFYLGFSNVRDSDLAVVKARSLRPEWTVTYLSPAQFAQKLNPPSPATSDYRRQVLVKASYNGPKESFNAESMKELLPELLANYGELLDVQNFNVSESWIVCVLAMFCDHFAAKNAAHALNGFKIQGCQLTVTWPGPDSEPASPTRPSGNLDGLYRDDHSISVNCQPEPELRNVMGRLSIGPRRTTREALCDHSVHSPSYSRLSPTGRSAVPQNEPISKWGQNHELPGPLTPRRRERPDSFPPSHNETRYFDDCYYPPSLGAWDVHGAIGQERGLLRQPNYHAGRFSPNRRSNMRTGGRHDHDYTSGHHNVVDVERIRRGLDVRTTIMLRNIPNKIDQAMLKEIVDETSAGKYDFMYLRIDFANNCNVGYAFINFEDPYFIIDFVEARAGLRWNRFNSDKVAEVSYATIQGKDCLVQKFRNSSVMLEHPSFRPKIFHTGTGPLAGTEDNFPGPDNPSKMRRSVENAEHVGLFAPRAGQHNRDEQRRRRSQYDRGTRLAEMDEAYEYQMREEEDFYRDQACRHGALEGSRFSRRPGRYELSY